MGVGVKCDYHQDGTEDLASVTVSLLDPEIIDGKLRIHRIFAGIRHDRFDWTIGWDEVFERLGLVYVGKDRKDHSYELWHENSDPEPTPHSNAHSNGQPSLQVPMLSNYQPLVEALKPFALIGSQLKGMPYKDTEPFPGTVSVGWLRNAARALGVDA